MRSVLNKILNKIARVIAAALLVVAGSGIVSALAATISVSPPLIADLDPAGNQTAGHAYTGVNGFSADNTTLLFMSNAQTLLPSGNPAPLAGVNTYVRDLTAGVNEQINVTSAGAPFRSGGGMEWSSISADGNKVAFVSAEQTVFPVDAQFNVYVRDRAAGTTTLESVSTAGVPVDDRAVYPSISADGNFVVFSSWGMNLDPAATSGDMTIFVRDLTAGTTELVSKNASGVQNNNDCFTLGHSISGDGNRIVYCANATNLVDGDTNSDRDVFLYDRTTNTTTCMSMSGAVTANGNSDYVSISDDGNYVVFSSTATDLAADTTNGKRNIFLYDIEAGEVALITGAADDNSNRPQLSADGSKIVFNSAATNLIPGVMLATTIAQSYAYDVASSTFAILSLDTDGEPANADAYSPVISPDGSAFAFMSQATNLDKEDLGNAWSDVFYGTLATEWNVTFDAQNGTPLTSTTCGGKLTQPADPQRDGYDFLGWFTDPLAGTLWNFDNDIVSGDMTLYAHWQVKGGGGGDETPTPTPDTTTTITPTPASGGSGTGDSVPTQAILAVLVAGGAAYVLRRKALSAE